MQITTIGLDLAKSVFQVHGVDAAGRVVVVRRFGGRRCCPFSPIARVSCRYGGLRYGPSLGAELIKLGHGVRLMPPAYVKPYGAPRRRVSPVEEDPPRELSIDLVADERFGRAIGRTEAS